MSAKKRQTESSDDATAPRRRHRPRRMARSLSALIVLCAGGGSLCRLAAGSRPCARQQRVSARPGKDRDHARAALDPHRRQGRGDCATPSFDGPLSLVDGELTVQMASAFAAHPWVAHVERVSKRFPAGLEVVLAYRRRWRMVEVDGGTAALPVDVDGVVLPIAGFLGRRRRRLSAHRRDPHHAVRRRGQSLGRPGRDRRGAGRRGAWPKTGKRCESARIVPAGRRPARSGVEYVFDLVHARRHACSLGPRTRLPICRAKLPAREKIDQLKRYAAQNDGTLDQPDGRSSCEIRDERRTWWPGRGPSQAAATRRE